MGIFDTGMRQLRERLGEAADVSIVYHRGAVAVVIEKVWLDRTAFKLDVQGNARIEWTDQDFMIPVERMTAAGMTPPPQDSDWVEYLHPLPSGETVAYRLYAPDGEQRWIFEDPQRTLIRWRGQKFVRVPVPAVSGFVDLGTT